MGESARAAQVLLVEDLPELRRAVSRTLRAWGHHVVDVGSARAALDATETQAFDVVLSDVMMPDMNGLELLRALHARDADLPVILISAVPTASMASQADECGAFACLAKPVDWDLLAATLARAVAVGQMTFPRGRLVSGDPRLVKGFGRAAF